MNKKPLILIADDSEMNRSIIIDMLGNEHDYIEAENGVKAVSIIQQKYSELSLVLLDLVMPQLDGFGVLETINKLELIKDLPVIMISSETISDYIEKAYNLGVVEFISRPFDAMVVRHRVFNTLSLYTRQKKLVDVALSEIYMREHQNAMMVDILGHIVEFRNQECGRHIQNVKAITEVMLNRLAEISDQYPLTTEDISRICVASALHDIGKISVDNKILNKPGKLTEAEFAVIKTHTTIGADMLSQLPMYQEEPLVKTAYEICRWHHERYDGCGYPDGLKGDEIPISAQVVALADVYDALTSERVYKPPYSHKEAIFMIQDGQCGSFNPLLLRCLADMDERLHSVLEDSSVDMSLSQSKFSPNIRFELRQKEELGASIRTLQLLEYEREKYHFISMLAKEIIFEYTVSSSMLTLSELGVNQLGLEPSIVDPASNKKLMTILGEDNWEKISSAVRAATPQNPDISMDCKIMIDGNLRWHNVIARTMWQLSDPVCCQGIIGKIIDIHDARMEVNELQMRANHDPLTGLFNRAGAQQIIEQRIHAKPDGRYVLSLLDLDNFKKANDTYGHPFGDKLLVDFSRQLNMCVRGNDIVARIGGDEFLLFLECRDEVEPAVNRIFSALPHKFQDFEFSVSMGVVKTEGIAEYKTLFEAADQALYDAKWAGKNRYCLRSAISNRTIPAISGKEGNSLNETEK